MTPARRVSMAIDIAKGEILKALADAQTGSAPTSKPIPFGRFIRDQREALGLSLQELADRAGCTKSHVWEIEDGRSKNPTVKMVHGLAEGLGVPVMAVFSAALIHARKP